MEMRFKMKKRMTGLLLAVLLSVEAVLVFDSGTTYALAKSAFITNKKFKGTYSYKGKKGNYEKGWYNLVIKKITKEGKVSFYLDKGGKNATPVSSTTVLTAKISGSKASFKYSEDGWGNKGKGTILFKKNGRVYLTLTYGLTCGDADAYRGGQPGHAGDSENRL